MGMAVWILFCLFSSVGLVQCGFWLVQALKKSESLRRGYHVIPLYDDADEIEAQIRFAMLQLQRSGLDGEFVLMVDMGLGEECQQICENLISGVGGIYICEEQDIAATIRQLDNLQIRSNVVEY